MGAERLRLSAVAAMAISAISIGLYKLVLEPGSENSIVLALIPSALVAALYAWAVSGHWFVAKAVPATMAVLATTTTFMSLASALAAVTDGGGGILVAVSGGAATASNLLALVLAKSPLLTGSAERIK
jgi:hypothetical protein